MGLAFLQLLVAAPASALPTGAYWYTLWGLPQAWKITQGAGVTVAVVDTGVDSNLGDLTGQVLPGLDLSSDHEGADHDTAVPDGGDFGHGSDMAALIAGTGKGAGMVGVAPQAKILPINIDDGKGGVLGSTIVGRGIRWAVDNGAQVINLSFGGEGACDPAEGAAISYAYQHNVIVVAASGDSGGAVESPANCPGAIAIGGIDSQFKAWTQTPSGPQIALVAPAFNLVNELLNGTLNGPLPVNSGTSQAAALVSGMFALMRSHWPTESARQIVARVLYNTHTGLGASYIDKRINDTLGYGMPTPNFTLTSPTPADAPNPLYDQFDKDLGLTGGAGSSTPSSATSASPAPTTSKPAAARSSSSSSSTGIVIAIVVVVLLVVGALVWLLSRRNRGMSARPGG